MDGQSFSHHSRREWREKGKNGKLRNARKLQRMLIEHRGNRIEREDDRK